MPSARTLLCLIPLLVAACSVADSRTAHYARSRLMGLSEADLEACLGVPDQHATFGNADVLTYYTNSSSSMNYSIPVIGGIGFSNGGNCHATNGHVTQILYSGEKNAVAAPDAYCAPILRTCLEHLDEAPSAASASPAPKSSAASP